MSETILGHAERMITTVTKYMFGMEGVIHLCLVALYSRGHVLLEGNPGMGKTELVKVLAEALRADWGRIQFTPDLMPSDITGSFGPNPLCPSGPWEFNHGPIFRQLLLADEINRATPKTQSAMLQAMQERQVTVLKVQEDLPRPFMVLATQNPVDQEGTYELPEAQSDRFMFKILVPTPRGKTMNLILEKDTGSIAADFLTDAEREEINQVRHNREAREHTTGEALDRELADTVAAFSRDIRATPLGSLVCRHIDNIYLATNGRTDELYDVDPENVKRLTELARFLQYGLGPRAATSLALGAKSWALLPPLTARRAGAVPPNVPANSQWSGLARVALPTLRHRIKPRFDWGKAFADLWNERHPKSPVSDEGPDATLRDRFIVELVLLTAPKDRPYQLLLQNDLFDTLDKKLF